MNYSDLNKVRKAYKDQDPCSACGGFIDKGDSYWWWRIRGPEPPGPNANIKFTRCRNNECLPTLDELRHPAFYRELRLIRRKVLRPDLDRALELLHELQESLTEKFESIPNQFQHGPAGRVIQGELEIVAAWIEFLGDDHTPAELEDFVQIFKHSVE
jgi:hypothetical protein